MSVSSPFREGQRLDLNEPVIRVITVSTNYLHFIIIYPIFRVDVCLCVRDNDSLKRLSYMSIMVFYHYVDLRDFPLRIVTFVSDKERNST